MQSVLDKAQHMVEVMECSLRDLFEEAAKELQIAEGLVEPKFCQFCAEPSALPWWVVRFVENHWHEFKDLQRPVWLIWCP
jgi:hypothetical protein